jgi:hypothetical protein
MRKIAPPSMITPKPTPMPRTTFSPLLRRLFGQSVGFGGRGLAIGGKKEVAMVENGGFAGETVAAFAVDDELGGMYSREIYL